MPAGNLSLPRRLARLAAGLAALALLAVLLVGAPLALLAVAGNPLPDHLPTPAEITSALTRPDDGRLFLRALAVLGWGGWATFALSVLVEIPARLLRLPVPRLPGLRTQQRAAAGLVTSVILLLTAGATATAATAANRPAVTGPAMVVPPAAGQIPAAPPAAGQVAAAPPAAGQALAARSAAGQVGPVAGRPVAEETAVGASEFADATSGPVYRVRRGDYLGHIADRYLGDFERFRELAKLNKLRNPDLIVPGQRVRLPADAHDGGRRAHATGVAHPQPEQPPSGRLPPELDRDLPSGPFAPEVADARLGPGKAGGQVGPNAPGERVGPPAAGRPGGPPEAGRPGGRPEAGRPGDPQVPSGPFDPDVPSGPLDPDTFAGSAMVAAVAAEAAGPGVSGQPPGPTPRGRLALAVAAVVAAAGVVVAQMAVVLGLRRRRPVDGGEPDPPQR